MTPTTIQLLPATALLAGDKPTQTGNIPDGYVTAQLLVSRSGWTGPVTATDVIRATLDVSMDGGTTWATLASFTTSGGALYPGQRSITYTPPAGATPIPNSGFQVPLPNLAGRKYRVTTNALAALTTSVTLTLS